MAELTLIKDINGKDFVIGHVCKRADGTFWFNPRLSGHKPSRKRWDNRQECIPKWALDMADRIEEQAK